MPYEQTIARCSRLLDGRSDIGSNGRMIYAPLLSVFLGVRAELHREDVINAYRRCWPDADQVLQSLETETYSVETVEERSNAMLATHGIFAHYRSVRVAYYWDIMDEGFDAIFEKIQQPLTVRTAITMEKLFFVFCRETSASFRVMKKQRLGKLIDWAMQSGQHLVVLSDVTNNMGVIGEDDLGENYRLAADIMLIANSDSLEGEGQLGIDLSFNLNHAPLYSAGYYFLGKNTRDIVRSSLWKILDLCQMASSTPENRRSVRDCLCGETREYTYLFDSIFQDKIIDLLPENAEFLRYLPYTDEVRKLDESWSEASTGRLFFRRSVRATGNQNLGVKAIESLGDIWKLCVERYYIRPIQTWLTSEAGEKCVSAYFNETFNRTLNYKEMSELLRAEANHLHELAEENCWRIPDETEKSDLSEWFHQQACRELKATLLYSALAQRLSEAMLHMYDCACGFGEVLDEVKQNIRIDTVEHTVRNAYEYLIDNPTNRTDSYRSVAFPVIHPCLDEEELLQQLETVFQSLVESEPKYRCSLGEDLNFRIQVAGIAGVDKIIDECFNQDMKKTGRLPTYNAPSGQMYCMLSVQEDFRTGIDPAIHGAVFNVPRRDCIERIFLYQVKPDDIIY